MPDGRFLSKSIAYSAQIGSVSLEADYLFMRMIPHLDSAGRMVGTPASVKALVCPLRPELTAERVAGLLKELHDAGLIVWYESGGQHCTSFPGFVTHQRGARLDREGASRLPPPPKVKAAKLRRTPENSGERRVSKEKLSEVKSSKGKTAGAEAPQTTPAPTDLLFSEAWDAYPRRSGSNPKADALRAWKARVADGVGEKDMLDGTRRYADFCTATAKHGTEYVMQARRFFGPKREFGEPWGAPTPSGASDLQVRVLALIQSDAEQDVRDAEWMAARKARVAS